MPKNKRHRKRSPSSSSSSSSVSSDSTDSTSTSDSSSSDSSQEKRHLKRKVRKLKRKLSTKSNRYEGKIDSVPMFGGGFEEMNVQQWIHTINATGDVFGWDDKARIFCMTNKLRGNAKSWYNNQDKLDLSWKQWKKNLIEAFPPQQGVFDKLKELVNVQREKHQSLVDIIINTINDPFLKSGARAAGCVSTKHLLQFLIANVEQREPIRASGSGFVKNRLGKRSPIPVVNDSKVVKCYLCGREGHKKVDCFKYKSDKTCNYCKIKGHVEDECFKKKRGERGPKKTINKLSRVRTDEANEKFHKQARVANKIISAYVDFGSGCNTMKIETARKLKLEIKPDETNVVIEGYGGAMINPIGIVKTEVEIDEIKTVTNFYVVPDTLQTVDILVGRPITEQEGVFVYKTPDSLKLAQKNVFEQLPGADAMRTEDKFEIISADHTIVRPGVNFISVKTNIKNGTLFSKFSEQYRSGDGVMIPINKLKIYEGVGTLRIFNISGRQEAIDKDTCIARASQDNQMTLAFGNVDETTKNNKLQNVIGKYPRCLGQNDALLSNVDIELHIELTTTVRAGRWHEAERRLPH
jgi:hypothetical protein